MMNITKLAALAIAAIVVTGCASTPRSAQFDPNNKGIVFLNGKPYLVPYGATSGKKLPDDSMISSLKKFLDHSQIPHNCKSGDLMWTESNYFNSYKQTTGRERVENMRTGFMTQRMGCTSALSATEYDYYKNAEIQRTQQVRHNQNLQMQQQQMNQAQWNNVNNSYQPRNCITQYGFTTCF